MMKHNYNRPGFATLNIPQTNEDPRKGSKLRSSCQPMLAPLRLLFVISTILTACLAQPATPNAPPLTPAAAPLTPQPIVQAFPSRVAAGTTVTLRGSNFKPNELIIFYLRDASRPAEPILQIGSSQVSPEGVFEWSFKYPAHTPWANMTHVGIIVQLAATSAYFTADLTVDTAASLAIQTVVPPNLALHDTPAPAAQLAPPSVVATISSSQQVDVLNLPPDPAAASGSVQNPIVPPTATLVWPGRVWHRLPTATRIVPQPPPPIPPLPTIGVAQPIRTPIILRPPLPTIGIVRPIRTPVLQR